MGEEEKEQGERKIREESRERDKQRVKKEIWRIRMIEEREREKKGREKRKGERKERDIQPYKEGLTYEW